MVLPSAEGRHCIPAPVVTYWRDDAIGDDAMLQKIVAFSFMSIVLLGIDPMVHAEILVWG